MRRLILSGLAGLLGLGLAGCAGPNVVVMRNPKTGEIVQCHGQTTGASLFPLAQARLDGQAAASCAQGYQAAGWRRMN